MFNSNSPTGPSQPPDPKTMMMTVVLALSAGLSFMGDQYCFVHAPLEIFSKVTTIPTYIAYGFFQNRYAADGAALVFWLVLFVAFGLIGYHFFVRYYLEPKQVKDYLKKKKRQEELLSKHSD